MGSYLWKPFYQELGRVLLAYESRQTELIDFAKQMAQEGLTVMAVNDRDIEGGPKSPLREIDPFSFFSIFNRGIKQQARIDILKRLKEHFGMSSAVPSEFEGVPTMNNQNSWFIAYRYQRRPQDVPNLWKLFKLALSDDPVSDLEFWTAFETVLTNRRIRWNITFGLFWIRPDCFVSLDQSCRKKFGPPISEARELSPALYQSALRTLKTSGLSPTDFSLQAYAEQHRPLSDESDEDESLSASKWAESLDVEPDGDDFGVAARSSFLPVLALGQKAADLERCQQEGLISLGWAKVGDLRTYSSKSQILDILVATSSNQDPWDSKRPTLRAASLWSFFRYLKPGQRVYIRRGRSAIVGVVKILGDYEYRPERGEFPHVRRVIWEKKGKALLPEGLKMAVSTLVFTRPSSELGLAIQAAASKLMNTAYPGDTREEPPPEALGQVSTRRTVTIQQAFAGLFFEMSDVRSWLQLLQSKRNIILQGPPGVGKTLAARRLAQAVLGHDDESCIFAAQFHESMGYEDFVEGLRVAEGGEWRLRDGLFKRAVMRARKEPVVLILDEINRGNLSRILGECMVLLEPDKRTPQFAVRLAYSPDTPFWVPESLYVIGTMNTADRSLALVDFAMRRRFAFVDLPSAVASAGFRSALEQGGAPAEFVQSICKRMTDLNRQIEVARNLGQGYQVGHSFFCVGRPAPGSPVHEWEAWFDGIVRFEIGPLLQEYWFDDRATAQKWEHDLYFQPMRVKAS